MNKTRIALVLLVAILVAVFFGFHLDQYFSLAYLQSRQAALQGILAAHPVTGAAVYFLIYVVVTGLSLPGAVILTLAGGAIFGLLWGTVIVSFASSIGATLAFLVARFVLRKSVQRRFGSRLETINRGVERDGAFYLFTLRLVPIFPFFVINLVMALTPIRTATFYAVSQVGMLAGTVVYINAGTQLAQIHSLGGIISPGLIASFVLLGVFPLIARKIVQIAKTRKALRGYPKPRRFDTNLVVIGAGSAGLVAAYIAAAVKARVTLIEKHEMGGDCLNTGCVPSKALIRSARVLALMRRAGEFGLDADPPAVDFQRVMARVRQVIEQIAAHDSVQRYTDLGVDVIEGEATVTSPYTVQVGDRQISTRAIVIAAGARPLVPPIPGLDQVDYLTSDTVWELQELPPRMIVLGGGPLGCELAQAFARLGSQVTQVEALPRLLAGEDEDISARVHAGMHGDGVSILIGHKAVRVQVGGDDGPLLVCESDGREVNIAFDRILVAVGRCANTEGYGLEALGISTSSAHTLEVNEFLQTRFPNVFACGDVVGPFQFTHVGAHQAWYATVNALFGLFRKYKVDYSVIPRVTFTDPEIARVGMNEDEACERGVAYEVTSYDMADLDRAIAEGEARGVVKVLTVPGKDKILGATIVGDHAGELIAEYNLALRHGLGLNKILRTIHPYPTFAEAAKYAAGAWKRQHAPQWVLAFLQRFHAWRRGRSTLRKEQ